MNNLKRLPLFSIGDRVRHIIANEKATVVNVLLSDLYDYRYAIEWDNSDKVPEMAYFFEIKHIPPLEQLAAI